jgi:hypothetical protein
MGSDYYLALVTDAMAASVTVGEALNSYSLAWMFRGPDIVKTHILGSAHRAAP